MFNRKKKRISELTYLADMWKDQVRVGNVEIRQLREDRDNLIRSNGNLKHDLDTESRQKEEFAKLLSDAQNTIESQRKTIESQQNEILYLYEGGCNSNYKIKCPSDCVTHANPGNGASKCRNCIRNPHAVDKYQRGDA